MKAKPCQTARSMSRPEPERELRSPIRKAKFRWLALLVLAAVMALTLAGGHNARGAASLFPSDPDFEQQWNLHNSQGGPDIDAPLAWHLRTDSDVIVAVIDTGVDYLDPDLAQNMWTNPGEIPRNNIDDDGNGYKDDVYGWNFVDRNNNPSDNWGHGSACASVIGAVANNGRGVAGVCWRVKIMALKIANDSSGAPTSRFVEAIDYARLMGAKVINCSQGDSPTFDPDFKSALDRAEQAGILVVIAAGNRGWDIDSSPSYPASFHNANIISVAATDRQDDLWVDGLIAASNYGAVGVDLGAPGAGVPCLDRLRSGTSIAAPHVAGACALVWAAADAVLTAQQVKQAILSNVDPVPALQGKCVTGGRLNLYKAVQAVYDDFYEPNDTLNTPYLLPSPMRYWLSNLHRPGFQKDEDWYRITVPADQNRLLIFCSFSHAEGDIDIELRSQYNDLLASSRGYANTEIIDVTLPAITDYYFLRVFYGNGRNEYDFLWGTVPPGTGLADLVVDSITCSPSIPLPGSEVQFDVTVRNQGTGPAGNFAVSFWPDRPDQPSTIELGQSAIHVLGLDAGASTTLHFNATAGTNGEYRAWAYVDNDLGGSDVTEANEFNNAGPAPDGRAWSVRSPYLYNGLIADFTQEDDDTDGYAETASFDLRIDADVYADQITTVAAHVHCPATGHGWDVPAWTIQGTAVEYGTLHLVWPRDFPGVSAGTYNLEFSLELFWPVGSTPAVQTSSYVQGTPLPLEYMPRPDLVISDLRAWPVPAIVGSTVDFFIDVSNQGDADAPSSTAAFWLDRATPPQVSDPADAIVFTPSLAAGQTTTVAVHWSGPLSPGNYRAWAFADRNTGPSSVKESNEENNAGPLPNGLAWSATIAGNSVSLPQGVAISACGPVETTLWLTQNSGAGVEYSFDILFDSALAATVQNVRLGTLAPQANLSWFVQHGLPNPLDSVLHVLVANTGPLNGSGPLALISWVPNPAAQPGQQTRLYFDTALRDGYPLGKVDGQLRVVPLTLNIVRQGSQLLISWPTDCILQTATSLNGNWIDLPNATNPYLVTPTPGTRFFRSRTH